ncbi:hypothetical protein CALVIDRAFT_379198 [Calocera viscosa TUFC12733]|uniref:Integrase zinc-binding domain-containing protein n=1 Tax=Calocera viscosa (strain TUFC12733) TaxID=1330018 RepID=A0A167Q3G9_CALVF|nr:hypothetical protein CALVIDRAFT_379198 [Calocera viscosa TUFC12733]
MSLPSPYAEYPLPLPSSPSSSSSTPLISLIYAQDPTPPSLSSHPLSSFPTPPALTDLLTAYLTSLHPSKRAKALLSRSFLQLIHDILASPQSTSISDAQTRFWARRQFTLLPAPAGDLRVCHHASSLPLAPAEHIWRIVTEAHARVGHVGRDRTVREVQKEWAGVPKEVVGRYVKACPGCRGVRKVGGVRGAGERRTRELELARGEEDELDEDDDDPMQLDPPAAYDKPSVYAGYNPQHAYYQPAPQQQQLLSYPPSAAHLHPFSPGQAHAPPPGLGPQRPTSQSQAQGGRSAEGSPRSSEASVSDGRSPLDILAAVASGSPTQRDAASTSSTATATASEPSTATAAASTSSSPPTAAKPPTLPFMTSLADSLAGSQDQSYRYGYANAQAGSSSTSSMPPYASGPGSDPSMYTPGPHPPPVRLPHFFQLLTTSSTRTPTDPPPPHRSPPYGPTVLPSLPSLNLPHGPSPSPRKRAFAESSGRVGLPEHLRSKLGEEERERREREEKERHREEREREQGQAAQAVPGSTASSSEDLNALAAAAAAAKGKGKGRAEEQGRLGVLSSAPSRGPGPGEEGWNSCNPLLPRNTWEGKLGAAE